MTYSVTHNAQFDSLEVRFDTMPTPAVRTALKALRFRWHGVNRYWYGKADENALRETLNRLIERADRIANANRERNAAKKAERVPVAPTPKTSLADAIMTEIRPAVAEIENAVRAECDRVLESAKMPNPFPKREDLKPLSFSYRIGQSCGQANLSLELLENAPASTLKVIYPMFDGIENTDERKKAWFTLTALAWYKAAENPEKRPSFRSAADLYREKTGEDFPAPKTETDGKPAAPKAVTAAMKRIAKGADNDTLRGLLSADGVSVVGDGVCAVYLSSAVPDLRAPKDYEAKAEEWAHTFLDFLHGYDPETSGAGDLPLPSVKELKTWLKLNPPTKARPRPIYRLDGICLDAIRLLAVMESLPGCTAIRPSALRYPVLFVHGEDRGLLMQRRPETEESAA